jgi:hypothetical protein
VPWGDITQPVPSQPKSNWQAPYDEHLINGVEGKWVFFFHHLNLREPLETSIGPRRLPDPRPLPEHLRAIEYKAP